MKDLTVVDLAKLPELEFLKIQERVMNFILTKKMEEGKIVFSEVTNGMLN